MSISTDSDLVATYLRQFQIGFSDEELAGLSRLKRAKLRAVRLVLPVPLSLAGYTLLVSLPVRESQKRTRTIVHLARVAQDVEAVQQETVKVQGAVVEMSAATSHTQWLALKVGVSTAILRALLGAFAGAFAARIIGG